jgi:hypothetical protein
MMTQTRNSEKIQQAPNIWGWPTFLSIAVTIIILAVLAVNINLGEIWQKITAANKRLVLVGALCHYATYLVRGYRWQRCLIPLPIKTGTLKFGLLVFFYNFIDNLVPAKLGDVYAGHLARINCGVRRSTAIGSIVFLRMVDAWLVLALAFSASWILFSAKLPASVFWSLIFGGVIALGATTIILVFFLFKKSLPGWLPDRLQQMVRAFQGGMWPHSNQLLPVILTTLMIWTLESLWIYFLTAAFALTLTPVQIIFLTMIPLLASAFPFTPSGTGVVELTLFSCLRLIGVSAPLAASLTVVNRFIDYWLHIILGMLTWSIRRVFGLRSWREVPLEALNGREPPDLGVKHRIMQKIS